MVFGAFERMVAFRYLRARRQEGFVSVIAIFSLLGIALGVATLIIVMSVMNGFRADLLARILGLNGDLGVYAMSGGLADFDAVEEVHRDAQDRRGASDRCRPIRHLDGDPGHDLVQPRIALSADLRQPFERQPH